jgi:hypothetical protein
MFCTPFIDKDNIKLSWSMQEMSDVRRSISPRGDPTRPPLPDLADHWSNNILDI